jgi:hypothetical protein
MTDWRALCAELLAALKNAIRVVYHEDGTQHISTADSVIAKADAALAQPEQAGDLSDDELEDVFNANCYTDDYGTYLMDAETFADGARAAIALDRSRRAPVPVAVSEVAELAQWLRKHYECALELGRPDWAEKSARAADLLEQRHPAPVPVSEWLPGPEDCIPHPRTKLGSWCWGFERCEVSLARPARWRLMHMETVEFEASHWLPAHALPIPSPLSENV